MGRTKLTANQLNALTGFESDASSGRDDTADTSAKEKLMYNLQNHVYAKLIGSIHFPGYLGIVAIRDIPNETDPFILCNIPINPEMHNISESSLH